MTVAEFREKAVNQLHDWDDMNILEFIHDPNIQYIDKLRAIYGYNGSNVPLYFKLDAKNILNIDIK
jgi:hypothetical protein